MMITYPKFIFWVSDMFGRKTAIGVKHFLDGVKQRFCKHNIVREDDDDRKGLSGADPLPSAKGDYMDDIITYETLREAWETMFKLKPDEFGIVLSPYQYKLYVESGYKFLDKLFVSQQIPR